MREQHNRSGQFAFTRAFATVSLIAVLVSAVALAALYREQSIRTVIDFGERSNVTTAIANLSAVYEELEPYLTGAKPTAEAGVAESLPPGLSRLVSNSIRHSAVERIKIYDRNGTVLFSSREYENGTDDSANPRFQRAIQGEVRSKLQYHDVLDLFARASDDDNLIETYVPIWQTGNPRPIGVFEVYTDVNPMVRAMDHNELLVFSGIAAILAILYGSLLYVVHRSATVIAGQQQTIVERNRTLEAVARHTITAEEMERGRISWELHEEIAQILSAIKIKVEGSANASAPRAPDQESIPREEIVPLIQRAIRDVRALATEIYPPSLRDFGLIATTRALCQDAEQARGKQGIILDIGAREEDIPNPLKSVIFRIVQQTLKDLIKTSGIGDIRISLRDRKGLRLFVEFGESGSGADDSIRQSISSCKTRLTNYWQHALLSGGSFTATETDDGNARYQAVWSV